MIMKATVIPLKISTDANLDAAFSILIILVVKINN
jgi:hypothetical protein